jgi:hypothetical protein
VIEILSPSNKRPGGRDYLRYQSKRQSLLYSPVHLIEIDLLRAGERPRLARPVPNAPYYVTVSRADQRPEVDVWPIQLWERLPRVPTPLLPPDPDVMFDLSLAVAEAYERLGYQDRFNYQEPPPPPPLSKTEAAWVEQLLAPLRQVGG